MTANISSSTPLYVTRVTVDGLARTSDQFMRDQLRCVREATNWGELKLAIENVTNNLYKFDIFEHIVPTIDVAAGNLAKDAANDCFTVHFNVKEKNWRKLTVQASADINNKIDVELSGKLVNVRGCADSIIAQYQKGLYGGHLGKLAYRAPYTNSPDTYGELGAQCEVLDHDWAHVTETNHSVYATMSFLSHYGDHLLKFGPIWRYVTPKVQNAVSPRLLSSRALKWSLRHVFERDSRDNVVFPRLGGHLRTITEYGRVIDDIQSASSQHFIKHEVESSTVLPLPHMLQHSGFSMVATFGCGMGYGFGKDIFLTDRFFLGGPLNLRGFKQRTVGPSTVEKTTESRIPNGTEGFYLGGLHLYLPLPYFRTSGVSRHLRLHTFINCGGPCPNSGRLHEWWKSDRHLHETLAESGRVSVGAGFTLAVMGIARMELNYCVPWITRAGDQPAPGLRFGLGLHFL